MVENLYCNLRAHSHWRFAEVAWPSWSQVVVWLKSDCFGSVAQLLDFSVFRLQFESYWTNQLYRSGTSVYNDIYFTLQWWCKQGERHILWVMLVGRRISRACLCGHRLQWVARWSWITVGRTASLSSQCEWAQQEYLHVFAVIPPPNAFFFSSLLTVI